MLNAVPVHSRDVLTPLRLGGSTTDYMIGLQESKPSISVASKP